MTTYENNVLKAEDNLEKAIDELKDIIGNPRWFLISYFDDIKAKVDFEYAKNESDKTISQEEKDLVNKEWDKLVVTIEKCQEKCLKNRIPDDLIETAKSLINKIESNKTTREIADFKSKEEIKEMRDLVKNHLFANESYLVILFDYYRYTLVVAEFGLDAFHIGILKDR